VIIGSIALVLVAAALWVIGLRESSDLWYYSSIVASVLAAFALLTAVRQRAQEQIPEDDFDVDPLYRPGGAIPVVPRPTGRAAVPRAPLINPPHQREEPAAPPAASPNGFEPEPPDEPPAQVITDKQASLIAVMTAEVAVIDGRPRYHETGCLHLLGREVERLPVAEAVQLGFTPCGQCEPARGLLATRPHP
jgi:hypothetical protein